MGLAGLGVLQLDEVALRGAKKAPQLGKLQLIASQKDEWVYTQLFLEAKMEIPICVLFFSSVKRNCSGCHHGSRQRFFAANERPTCSSKFRPGSAEYREAIRSHAVSIRDLLKSVPQKDLKRPAVYVAADFRPEADKLRASLAHNYVVAY